MSASELMRINALIKARCFDDALRACDVLIAESATSYAAALRLRAAVRSAIGDFDSAIQDYLLLLESDDARLSDWYLAADNALEARRFTESAQWFQEVLRRGEVAGEDWYKGASLFYLSYCELMIGEPHKALVLLETAEKVDPSIELHLPGLGLCNISRLRLSIGNV